ncbi:MAG: hypothetical protein ACRC68_17215 [Clostridium sp.]
MKQKQNNVSIVYRGSEMPPKDKIRWCATFNAPGFGPEFIKDNELMIKILVEAGIISEYQNVHDFVSSLMKNPSKAIVIEPVGKNIGSYEKYHYICNENY